MRKISKEELRHGTWFRKMMVVTVFLFIAMIAAGAAMQMAEERDRPTSGWRSL